jgi:nitrite reductase/ring-hydroxylating ferredoxin subunit
VSIGDRELAIFNLGPSTEVGAADRFLAVDNQCPHKAGPLADGIVTGTSVVCPLHTWKINLVDGCVERPQGAGEQCVATYAVCVDHWCRRRERAAMKRFLRAGHFPTLFASLLYFDVSFMAWILLGPLGPFLREELGLSATAQG